MNFNNRSKAYWIDSLLVTEQEYANVSSTAKIIYSIILVDIMDDNNDRDLRGLEMRSYLEIEYLDKLAVTTTFSKETILSALDELIANEMALISNDKIFLVDLR